jgi:hypothetical protein
LRLYQNVFFDKDTRWISELVVDCVSTTRVADEFCM